MPTRNELWQEALKTIVQLEASTTPDKRMKRLKIGIAAVGVLTVLAIVAMLALPYFSTNSGPTVTVPVSHGYLADNWQFYRDSSGLWRWRRSASNGKIVGASHQGYPKRSAAVENALRHGYLPTQE